VLRGQFFQGALGDHFNQVKQPERFFALRLPMEIYLTALCKNLPLTFLSADCAEFLTQRRKGAKVLTRLEPFGKWRKEFASGKGPRGLNERA
jgi:hypothetical protein